MTYQKINNNHQVWLFSSAHTFNFDGLKSDMEISMQILDGFLKTLTRNYSKVPYSNPGYLA